jgi:hypothetical protein
MRTRTLLLLAVTCGLAVLLAGGVQLLRLSNQKKANPILDISAPGVAGDARVAIADVSQHSDPLVVTVTISGVDDPAAVNGFSLVVPGKLVRPVAGPGACTKFTVAPVECTLTFPMAGVTGTDRILRFDHAAERVLWKLV